MTNDYSRLKVQILNSASPGSQLELFLTIERLKIVPHKLTKLHFRWKSKVFVKKTSYQITSKGNIFERNLLPRNLLLLVNNFIHDSITQYRSSNSRKSRFFYKVFVNPMFGFQMTFQILVEICILNSAFARLPNGLVCEH